MAGLGIVIKSTDGPGKYFSDIRAIQGTILLSEAELWGPTATNDGGILPNLAWQETAKFIPGTENELAASFHRGPFTASELEITRTSKNGIHGAVTAGSIGTNSHGASPIISEKARDWIYQHYTDHAFYISAWMRPTRGNALPAGAITPLVGVFNTGSPTGNYKMILDPKDVRPPSAGLLGYDQISIDNTSGIVAIAATGTRGTIPPTSNPGTVVALSPWGRVNRGGISDGTYIYSQSTGHQSHALYALWVVDLTEAGMTWGQVHTLDQQAFNIAFSAGGRYYGDVMPSLIP